LKGFFEVHNLSFFREGTRRICSTLDIGEALQKSLVFLKKFMPLNCIRLSLFEPSTGTIRIVAHASDFIIRLPLKDLILLSEETQGYLRAHSGETAIVGSTNHSPLAKELSAAMGLHNFTGIGMTLQVKGEQLGYVGVLSKSGEQFTPEHARLLELLHDPFAIAISNHLHYKEVLRLKELLADDSRFLHKEIYRLTGDEIVGEKLGLSGVIALAHQIAQSDSPVLLLGETGVGKEVIANAIHYSSPRSNGPFIKINCGALPEGLIDSELFGHEKGSFTGATMMQRGRFERANGGSIFLDEVGDLPVAAQVRLLRVLQEKQIERVGGTNQIPANARVIAATHRDLEVMVQRGEFREDLWYRINVFPIVIPPLRDRKSDIPDFVYYFIGRKKRRLNLSWQPVLAQGALELLQQYDWPGNIRELENVVERELIRSKSKSSSEPLRFEEIIALQFKRKLSQSPEQIPFFPSSQELNSVLRAHFIQTLQMTKGKIQGNTGAAALLGIHPSTLRHRLRKLKIPFGRPQR
jgi:transcriptional regulator with GAF, ATPase, and Fis domain